MKEEQIGDLLPDDYPVYWDYLYVCDGELIRSDIQGTVKDLRNDLKSMGYHADLIYKYIPEWKL